MKSIKSLAFEALETLINDEDELWTADIIFKGEANRTGEIVRLMRRDCGTPEYRTQKTLAALVKSGLIIRSRQGVYEPNFLKVILKMKELCLPRVLEPA